MLQLNNIYIYIQNRLCNHEIRLFIQLNTIMQRVQDDVQYIDAYLVIILCCYYLNSANLHHNIIPYLHLFLRVYLSKLMSYIVYRKFPISSQVLIYCSKNH